MKGNEIIVSAFPQGKFLEGTIVGANIYPGTMMIIDPGVNPIGGRLSYIPANQTTGQARQLWILLPDQLQGGLYNQPYNNSTLPNPVTSSRGFLYAPIMGEELNVLFAGAAGTGSANAFTIGELAAINNAGLGVANSGYTRPQLTVQEHIDLTPDVQGWVWCQFNGG